VFPAKSLSVDPRSGKVRRHHINETLVQKSVKHAAAQAAITKKVSCHTLRHYAEFRTMPSDHVSSLSMNDLVMINSA
jgi:integrase